MQEPGIPRTVASGNVGHVSWMGTEGARGVGSEAGDGGGGTAAMGAVHSLRGMNVDSSPGFFH